MGIMYLKLQRRVRRRRKEEEEEDRCLEGGWSGYIICAFPALSTFFDVLTGFWLDENRDMRP